MYRYAIEKRYHLSITVHRRCVPVLMLRSLLLAMMMASSPVLAGVGSLTVPAPDFGTAVTVAVFTPPGYGENSQRRYPLLLVNDGQDADAVALAQTVQSLVEARQIEPVIVAAVPMMPDRMATYGYSDRIAGISLPAQTRYGAVGQKAHAYSEWLVHTLIPALDARFRTRSQAVDRTVLGWSLGAVSAFSVAWNYPDHIGQAGAFSPSFWLSTEAGKPDTAIAPELIAGPSAPGRFCVYLAVGDAEETDDRDGDGINDALDDAQDVHDLLAARYGKQNIALHVLDDGQHNQGSWKRMLPDFLRWAYPVHSKEQSP